MREKEHNINAAAFPIRLWQISWVMSLFFVSNCRPGTNSKIAGHKIIVEATITKWFHRELNEIFAVKDEIYLSCLPFPLKQINPSLTTIKAKVKNNKVRWEIYSNQAMEIYPPFGPSFILYPGDSVHILYKADYPSYSGSTKSLALIDTLSALENRLRKPYKKYSYNADNLIDYMDWNRYLDDKINLLLPAIESFRKHISPGEYNYYKSDLIGNVESNRTDAFSALYGSVNKGIVNLNHTNLVQIWDSTQYKPTRKWLNEQSEYNGSIYDIYTFSWMEIHRQAGFDTSADNLKSKEIYSRNLYDRVKHQYKGQLRERLLTRILEEEIIIEMGLKSPVTQSILQDYYSLPDYPEFKTYVKGIEKQREKREAEKRKQAKPKEKKSDEKQTT